MDQISEFLNNHYKNEWTKEAEEQRNEFCDRYPIERIKILSQEEYHFSGKQNTFCYQIQNDLAPLASMGNAYPAVFGVYVDSDGTRKLSPTLKNIFGSDYERALEYQKEEIISLINAGNT